MAEGQIIKALAGFYYVMEEDSQVIYECRGRGVFRKREITPLVGDYVAFDIVDEEKLQGYITKVHARSSELIRPPISNVNQVLLVFSVKKPDFNQSLLDRFLAIIEANGIEPVIVLTKYDLLEDESELEPYVSYYESIGYKVMKTSKYDPSTLEPLKDQLKDHISVFAGQSGVGKSSLLNALDTSLKLNVGEISKALGRGRHTTRHVELFNLYGGLIADTPGFSSLDFGEFDIDATILAQSFIDFFELSHKCKFRGCIHENEPQCAVKDKLGDNPVYDERYKNYLNFQKEIAGIRPVYHRKLRN